MEGLMRTNTQGNRVSRQRIVAFIAASVLATVACSATGGASPAPVETAPSAAPSAPASATPITSAQTGGGRGDYDYETTPSEAPDTSPAATGDVMVNVATGPLGEYLTGAGGLTLYIFKPDTTETSACDGGCAEAWPPFIVEAGAEPAAGTGVTGSLSSFARADGTLQVAYDGAPLYYFANDTTPGDTNGEGLGDNWFVARP
jgi:predicted lipoprotein with Yx(FWY)xxD motif